MESPQMASRSFFFKTSPDGFGAGTGLNFSSRAWFNRWSEVWAAIVRAIKLTARISFERIISGRILCGDAKSQDASSSYVKALFTSQQEGHPAFCDAVEK